jgi:ABC-2 type transport system ATP-binding protein
MAKQERQTRARELLADFGLRDAADRRFSGYSKGMKRKLTIAAGIIHKPEILFLDEPTTGIDVASARHLRQLIHNLHKGGTTIFLTTHYIEEAERLCDRIAFIVAGRIVEISSVADLLQPLQAKHVVEIACKNTEDGITERLSGAFAGLAFSSPKQGIIRVEADKAVKAGAIVHFLEEQGFEVSEARKIKPSLEEIFVRITGIEANALENENQKGSVMK